MEKSYWARFFVEDDGRYSVDVPDLPGCFTWGDTWDEAVYMTKDAVRGWLETTLEDGDPLPKASSREAIAARDWDQEFLEPQLEQITVIPFGPSERQQLPDALLADLARASVEQGVPVNELLIRATREFLARQVCGNLSG